MCVQVKTLVEVLDLLVHDHFVLYLAFKDIQLRLRGQISIEQQEAYLQEGAVSSQLIDGVSTIPKLTLVSIDESN
jgi:hypothetical protein